MASTERKCLAVPPVPGCDCGLRAGRAWGLLQVERIHPSDPSAGIAAFVALLGLVTLLGVGLGALGVLP